MNWPSTGTEYDSLYDCKLDILHVARNLRIPLTSKNDGTKNQIVQFRCRLVNWCSFHFKLQRSNDSEEESNSKWMIKDANLEHSHDFDQVDRGMKKEIVKRIEVFMKKLETEKKRASRTTAGAGSAGEGSEEKVGGPSSSGFSPEKRDGSRSTRLSKLPSREVKESFSSSFQPLAALPSGQLLPLPTSDKPISYSTAQEAFDSLQSAAKQRGLLLNRYSTVNIITKEVDLTEFCCRRKGCPYLIAVKVSEDGGWVASCEEDSHEGHEVTDEVKQVGWRGRYRRKRAREEEESESSTEEEDSSDESEDDDDEFADGTDSEVARSELGERLESIKSTSFRVKAAARTKDAFLPLTPPPSSSTRQLQLDTCAAASQRGFSLAVKTYEPERSLHLICSKGKSTSCGYFVRFEWDEVLGEWEVAENELKHTQHRIMSEKEAKRTFDLERKEEEKKSSQSPKPKKRKIRHSSTPSASSSSSLNQLPNTPPKPLPAPSFLPTLRAFLLTLHPVLPPHAEYLYSIGIRSLTALANLIWMDEKILMRGLGQEKDGRRMSGVTRLLVKTRLREVREGLQGKKKVKVPVTVAVAKAVEEGTGEKAVVKDELME